MEEKKQHLFERLVTGCMANTGHNCPGQVLGVRMAALALSIIGIEDPKGKDRKRLIVIVELDRCATDAIQYVTGCSIGKRTLKVFDYGKMAATFINLSTNVAVRVVAKEEAREIAKKHFPAIRDKYLAQAQAYRIMADDDLFEAHRVVIGFPYNQVPLKESFRTRCDSCGEYIQDRKEVRIRGMVVCRSCAEGRYYILGDRLSLDVSRCAAAYAASST